MSLQVDRSLQVGLRLPVDRSLQVDRSSTPQSSLFRALRPAIGSGTARPGSRIIKGLKSETSAMTGCCVVYHPGIIISECGGMNGSRIRSYAGRFVRSGSRPNQASRHQECKLHDAVFYRYLHTYMHIYIHIRISNHVSVDILKHIHI